MNPRLHCEDCQRLVLEEGEYNLWICENCEHYVPEGESCTCSDTPYMEARQSRIGA